MANVQKVIESAAAQGGHWDGEEGTHLIWSSVIGKTELLSPSSSQKGGLLLKGQLQLLADESSKTSKQRKDWVLRNCPKNTQP